MAVTPPGPDVENEPAEIDDTARQPALGASNLVVEVKRSDGLAASRPGSLALARAGPRSPRSSARADAGRR